MKITQTKLKQELIRYINDNKCYDFMIAFTEKEITIKISLIKEKEY